MDNINTELENFLQWFANQEDIPLQTRRDFFAHVNQIGGLDEKAIKFIDQAVDQIDAKNEKRALVLKQKIDFLESAIATQAPDSEFSLTENIIRNIGTWFNDQVDNFKAAAQALTFRELASEESTAHDLEMDQVAALKASL